MIHWFGLVLAMAPSVGSASEPEVAADFSLLDVQGQSVSLGALKGNVVVLSFWATWCGPCKEEMPHLQRIYTERADEGLVVLAISTDDARSRSRVRPFVRRNGYTFPVLLDRDGTVFSAYNPARSLPYTVIVDRAGNVVERKLGYDVGDEIALEAKLLDLLAASP